LPKVETSGDMIKSMEAEEEEELESPKKKKVELPTSERMLKEKEGKRDVEACPDGKCPAPDEG